MLTAWTPLPPGAQGCYQELNPPRPLSPVHGYRRGGGGVPEAALGNVLGATVPTGFRPKWGPSDLFTVGSRLATLYICIRF